MDQPFDLYVAGNGRTLLLSKKGEGRYGHLVGSTGFGMIPRSTRIRQGAAEGGVFLGARPTTRVLLVKASVLGNLEQQRTGLDELREALTAENSRLIVVREDGTWYLPVVYESGLEGDLTRAAANGKATLADVVLTAPEPFWLLSESTVVEARVSDDARVFLDDLAGLPLSDSVAIQDSVVSNPGDASVPVVWVLRGPCESAEVAVGGRGFSVPEGLTDGETLTVDPTVSGMPAVTDQDGESAYARLAMGPMFPKLPRGESTVHLRMDGAVAGERVQSSQVLASNVVSNPALRSTRDGWSVDDEELWAYVSGDPGRLDCVVDLNDRPYVLPHWLYNAKQAFNADAWYPNLQVPFVNGVATLVMDHVARKVCSVRAQDATLNWQNPYASITGTTYEVESYVSDGNTTFTITLKDKTVNATLLVVATDEGGPVIARGERYEAWPIWRELDEGETACAIDAIWWAWDDFKLLSELDPSNPVWDWMRQHLEQVTPGLLDVNDSDDWVSPNAGTDDPLDLQGSYWLDQRTPAASITRSRVTGAVDVTIPAGSGYAQYGRYGIGGQWAEDSSLGVQIASSATGLIRLNVDPEGDYDPESRYTALISLDGLNTVKDFAIPRSQFLYPSKLAWHRGFLSSTYSIYRDDGSTVTATDSADGMSSKLDYNVSGYAQVVLNFGGTLTEFPGIRYASPGQYPTLRVLDENGWYWYRQLSAATAMTDETPTMADFTTAGYQPNSGTAPTSFTGQLKEIAVTFSGSGSFTIYGLGRFVSPAVGTTISGISLYYDQAAAVALSLYYLRMLPVPQVPYSPWVAPFTVNLLSGRVNAWRGLPYAGYQAPWFWQVLGEADGVNTVLQYLSDSQDAYEQLHNLRGPFAAAYIWDRPDSADYGTPGTWYEDRWGGFQYRTLEVVARTLLNDPTLTLPMTIITDFLTWLQSAWTSSDAEPPSVFNVGEAPSVAGEEPHCVALILRSLIYVQQSGVMDDTVLLPLITQCMDYLDRTYVTDTTLDVYGTWSMNPTGETWNQFWNGEILTSLAVARDWYADREDGTTRITSIDTWLAGNLQFLTQFRRRGLPNALNDEYLAAGPFESGDSSLDWQRYTAWQSGASETQTLLLRGVLSVAQVTGSTDWLTLGLAMSEAMMQVLFDLRHTATWSMDQPETGWPASTISCSIATDSQLLVEFLDADGELMSRARGQQVMGRAGVQNLAIPDNTETIRLGSQGVSPQGVTQGLLVFGSTATGYFDGDSQWAEWQGDADASVSDLHASELEGGSLIQMSWHERKEIMR